MTGPTAASVRRAVGLGVLSSALFSVTYLVNGAMAQSGGNWMWGASLRFLLMLPVLFLIVLRQNALGLVWGEICSAPGRWLLWSTVGFGIFYAPLTFASAYGPSWLIAGTFQFTILAGALMEPLFSTENGRNKIPVYLLPAFFIIILGVFMLQSEQRRSGDSGLLFAVPVLVSAAAYPLGNRKMMALCRSRLTTLQRVFGMTVCSAPFWLVLSMAALVNSGYPSGTQIAQSAVVALFSGLLATLVFFHATSLVQTYPSYLALVESTQCGEVLFSLLGGILLLKDPLPGMAGWTGIALIVGGMICNSLLSARKLPTIEAKKSDLKRR